MKAVVPAAGKGTRLGPLTQDKPKGLVEIDDQPLLSHCFDRLLEYDISETIVVIGYLGEHIRDYYGQSYRGMELSYVIQAEQNGLAHAILQARDHIDADFLVLNGDNVFVEDFEEIITQHKTTSADATLLVEETDYDTARTTGVVVTDQTGHVRRLEEKPDDPSSNLITTGCYVLPPSIFTACEEITPSERGEYELPDALQWLLDEGGEIQTVRFDGHRINVNTPADSERAAALLTERE